MSTKKGKKKERRGDTFRTAVYALAIALFRVRRDVYLEQMPPAPVLLGILGTGGLVALLLFFVGPRVFRGGAGRLFRPGAALAVLAAVVAGGVARRPRPGRGRLRR